MKLISLFSLIIILSGCASYRPRQESSGTDVSALPSSKQISAKNSKKAAALAVWDLLNRETISLYFKNVDNGSYLTVVLGNRITEKEIPTGHWELTGFSSKGRTFSSMNTHQKFVFRMSPSSHNYGGSIVVGCPRIASTDYTYLKSMKFFNRYPFSSKQGLCEIVIGNDLASVQEGLRKSRKNKNLALKIGF